MALFAVLPAAFLALVFASPVLSAPSSSNDPFRALSAHATRQPEPPVCCLTPLPPIEPVEDEVLLSFEEWKEKQAALQASAKVNGKGEPPNHTNAVAGNSAHVNAGREIRSSAAENAVPVTPSEILDALDSDNTSEKLSPHFQVPLTDRFNYAGTDCSARVHLAHRSAKSPASILSSKRDRYMLSPCNSPKEKQFVVVELCEDIRIDTVQLANFEFFSGVFKDFTVSVSKTYKEDWIVAGTYRAKNIRGVQSFHPPPSLTGFYRFIRIDFHTHYSNEYYCPISLLRVYGLTHLEEWKWEIWEAESRAKREGLLEPSAPRQVIADESLSMKLPSSIASEASVKPPVDNGAASVPPSNNSSSTTTDDEGALSFAAQKYSTSHRTLPAFAWEQFATANTKETEVPQDSHELHTITNDHIAISTSTTLFSPSPLITLPIELSNTTVISSTQMASPVASSSSIVSVMHQVHNPPPAMGGESIYRNIMNRLTALEANHTLYVRYVEEQTNGVREMIRRLGEDIGRLDGIGKAQAQKFQRSLTEWENQRKTLEDEYMELVARIEYLSDEIVLEKRLGIAQLCLLLAVIVFIGLTRGSRGESPPEHGPLRFNRSMRDWGRRHLSFSGQWASRFIASSSPSRSPPRTAKSPKGNFVPQQINLDDGRAPFPTLSARPRGVKSASYAKPHVPDRKVQNVYIHARSRSRTPSLPLRTAHPHNPRIVSRPTTPTTSITTALRPQLQRANSLTSSNTGLPTSASFSAVGPVPKSAKRWARTAHLHEVKSPAPLIATANNKVAKDDSKNLEKKSSELVSNARSITTLLTTQDKAKSLDDSALFLEAPGRSTRRSNRYSFATSDIDKPMIPAGKRWTSSSDSSCDGDGGDLWVDTDATDTSVDGDSGGFSGFSFEEGM